MDLQGKTAIVTGGAIRIGRALSLALARAGANVVVHYSHSSDEAQRTVDEIQALGRESFPLRADFEKPVEAAKALFSSAIDRFGGVDILINSAAIFGPETLANTSEADWDRHFAINLQAPFFLCREFAAHHVQGRPAAIVNIADWRGVRPVVGYLSYALTKSALIMLTRILALELAPDIRVNAVAPGAILAPPGKGEDFMRRKATTIPLQSTGSPGDVASATLYLLQSDFVTGELLYVTGGEHLL